MRLVSALALTVLVAATTIVAAQNYAPWPRGAYNPYSELPIRYVIDTTNLTLTTTTYGDEVRSAFAFWAEDPQGSLAWNASFAEVPDRSRADIVVWFVDNTTVLCHDDVVGAGCGGFGTAAQPGVVYMVTKRERGEGEVTIGELYLPYSIFQQIARHEIGHALGLEHSSEPGNVMNTRWEAVTYSTAAPGSWLPTVIDRNPLLWLLVAWVALGLVVVAYRAASKRRRPPF